jgi:type II secretory pathway component PulF
VVRDAPAEGDIGKAIGSADLARNDARAIADHVRGSMLNGVPYLALLLAVAGIIAVVWLSNIGPVFRSLYSQMDVALPALSRVLVDQAWIFPAAIGALAIVLVGIVVAARRITRSVESVAPLADGLVGLIIGARVREAHDSWCILSLARAWAAAGEEPAQATHRAAQVLGADSELAHRLDAEMRLAAELGAAGNELDHMAQTSAASYRDAIELWRAVGLRGLQIAIAVVVGLLIIAIYLPIFKMGAIV